AFSLSRTTFSSSIVSLSVSGGSSSRIWRVSPHVSQPSVCVKKSARTGCFISANISRSFCWSAGERGGTESSLLEEIVEGLARAGDAGRALLGGRRRARLPLDARAGREERAHVAFVLRRDARGELRVQRALPPRARVERHALDAGVQIDAAL